MKSAIIKNSFFRLPRLLFLKEDQGSTIKKLIPPVHSSGSFLRFIISFIVLTPFSLFSQNNLNVDLFDQFNRGDARYSGSWTYVGPDNAEYALLGTRTGTAVYAIDEAPVQELAFIQGPESNWREITTIGDYAFVTTEGSSTGTGMQVLDLTQLPDTATLLTTYDETFTRGHIIQRDIYSDDPYVYVMGTSATAGVHILDISDPANPQEVGTYIPGYYIHDAHIKGDRMYAAAFYESTMDIVDISDKTSPTLIAQFDDQNGETHSSWVTEDDRYLFVCSEDDGDPAIIYDIQDLNNIQAVAFYTANEQSLVHNPYIRGQFAFISHNTEGLRVVDLKDPTLPVEVGYYDTFDGPSGGFSGLWSACPFLPSGKIIGGNREDGLYVWTFNNTEAARVYGTVVDSLTGQPIVNANVYINPTNLDLETNFDGQFKWGHLAGSYTIEAEAEDYATKTITLDLAQGDSLPLLIELVQPEITNTKTPPATNQALKLYPSPFTNQLTIQLNSDQLIEHVTIYGVNGKVMLEKNNLQDHQVQLNTGQLPKGIYMLRVTDNTGNVLVKKVLK